jgi:hypothetical protein
MVMRIDQAIFTSIQGSRLEGYQLAAASGGITPELERELTVWGPAHDSLWDKRRDARSVNFHPLVDDRYCLSCTTLAGSEYSGRGGGRVFTHMFVLPAQSLALFAYDPFLVLRALSAAGRLVVPDRVPTSLATVPLLGRSATIDARTLQIVIEEVGERTFQEMVEAVRGPTRVAALTSGHVERLFQAVLHDLAPEQRLGISFTTGLKESARRPFKLFVLPSDPSLVRSSQRMSDTRVVDLAGAGQAGALSGV